MKVWCCQVGEECDHAGEDCAFCTEWGPIWQTCEFCGEKYYGEEENCCESCLGRGEPWLNKQN